MIRYFSILLCLLISFNLDAQVKKRSKDKPRPVLLKSQIAGDPNAQVADTAHKVQPKKVKGLTRVLFIFDDSQSMLGQWQSGAKIDIAKKLLAEIIDSIKEEESLEIALRVYGHQKRYPPQDCNDTKLEVPFGKNNSQKIKDVLQGLTPKGTTPIARSLEACAKDFPSSPSRNIVILITDGLEECDSDPCKVSLALQKKGIFLKPFIIGIGTNTRDFEKQFECIGTYFDASNEKTFKNIMNVVISQALNNTSAQVNLLDIKRNPTETNVAMTFYESLKGQIKYNFVHTMNSRGNPDTLKIDPLTTYKLVIHTIPEVMKDSIKLTAGKHNIISVDASQGDLFLQYDSKSDYKQLQAIIRKAGDMNTLNMQEFNTHQRYLSGKYDLEILCLPRMKLKGVEITQSHTTTVKIDQPGLVTFVSNGTGYGSLYIEDNGHLEWFYNLDPNNSKETVILQPGNYRVIFRSKATHESIYTVEKTFKISSGVSTNIILNQ